jgi:hypothetical protein
VVCFRGRRSSRACGSRAHSFALRGRARGACGESVDGRRRWLNSVTRPRSSSNGAGQHIIGRTDQSGSYRRRRCDDFAAPTGSSRSDVSAESTPVRPSTRSTLTLFFDMGADTRYVIPDRGSSGFLARLGRGSEQSPAPSVLAAARLAWARRRRRGYDATWLYRFYNAASPTSSPTWTSPGAEGDYVTTASASTSITGSQGTPIAHTWSGAGLNRRRARRGVDGSSGTSAGCSRHRKPGRRDGAAI